MLSAAVIILGLGLLFLGFCGYGAFHLIRKIIKAEEIRVLESEKTSVVYVPAIRLLNLGIIPEKKPPFQDVDHTWDRPHDNEPEEQRQSIQ